tara:strand:- start:15095 stop:16486 length:1392 start_codon:yes stop_codon:yes gene_type:complete
MNWLQTQLEKNPSKIYIQERKNTYSYLDIAEMVHAYSQALLREGVKVHDRALIYLPCNVTMIEIILSCFEIGVIAIPISTNLTPIELDRIIKTLRPKIIISNWEGRKKIKQQSFTIACIEELIISSSGCSIIQNSYKKNLKDVCAIILTSGTSGTPKAVQLTYQNFVTSCNNWNEFLEFQSEDQFLCCLPLYHIGGFAVLIRALLYGFSVNLMQDFEEKNIHNTIEKYPVTIISLVPTMLKRILDIKEGLSSLKSLRHILLGGGPCPKYLLDLCIKEQLPIIKVYGMTETCSGTFGLKLLEEPGNMHYAGRPFPGVKFWIDNNEIHISGLMVMKGYFGEEEVQGQHNSHDLGYIKDDLLFLDIRRKDLIVSGGENINPIEVEECLINVDGIIDAVVVGKKDDRWGQKVIAYIVKTSTFKGKKYVQNELKKILSSYKIPKDYISVPQIPRNEIGKINYDKLDFL